MPDHVVQPVDDSKEKSKQTLQQYQSLWLAHWTQTGCKAAGETGRLNATGNEELDYGARSDDFTKPLEDSSRSLKGPRLFNTNNYEIGDDIIKVSSKSKGKEGMLNSLFNNGQDADSVKSLRPDFAIDSGSGIRFPFSIPVMPAANGIPSHECHSVGEGTSKNPAKWVRNHSTDFVFERKMNGNSLPDNLVNAFLKESITCDHHLTASGTDRLVKMQKSSGVQLFLSQCNSSVEFETKKSRNDFCSLLKLQNCIHDVEPTRLEGYPRFSQTTNSVLITKQTDVSTFKENEMFGRTRVITKVGGNSSEFHCALPLFGQCKQQLIHQPLNGLSDGEQKDNASDIKAFKVTTKNESSAETDIMHMDLVGENSKKILHSGPNSTASTKVFNVVSNIPPCSNVASSIEVGHGRLNNNAPDNLELPALPGAASSLENVHSSSSLTPSLEMNKLLEHVEQPKPKSNLSLGVFPNADPSSRWVKRLKVSSSNSIAQGTKNSNLPPILTREKMGDPSSGIPKSSTAGSAPTLGKQPGKKSVVSDKTEDFTKKVEDHLMETPKDRAKVVLLSHAWIQRWLHNGLGVTETKPETGVACVPLSSKISMEKLQKEQLPSIAAMALMAKALTCFQPCELQKRGSFTVWNTKTF